VPVPDSFDADALARFDKGVERRVAQFLTLKTIYELQATAYVWAQPLLGNANIVRVDEERRAYVAAASAAATTPTRDRSTSLRMLDLRAQKLIQTVEALRDSADMARGRILIAIDGMVAMSLGIGVLLMVYLIWKPLLGGARHSRERPSGQVDRAASDSLHASSESGVASRVECFRLPASSGPREGADEIGGRMRVGRRLRQGYGAQGGAHDPLRAGAVGRRPSNRARSGESAEQRAAHAGRPVRIRRHAERRRDVSASSSARHSDPPSGALRLVRVDTAGASS
jgi:hypothetical protein